MGLRPRARFARGWSSAIKMEPSQVTKANEAQVWDTLYGNDVQKPVRFKFQDRRSRRIKEVKKKFEKSYLKKFLLFTSKWLVKYPFTN